MRTLIIISHPTIEESLNQQFFKEASAGLPATWHHLESSYPDGKIDIETELQLLAQHDRIIFQFPFYWYSSPAHLKIWQDNVLERAAHVLKGKELGIVLTTGVAEKEYQAGGKEEYTISEFLRPYQRIANKFLSSAIRFSTIYVFIPGKTLGEANCLSAVSLIGRQTIADSAD